MRWAKDGPVSVGAGPEGPEGEEVGAAGRDVYLPEGCRDVGGDRQAGQCRPEQ